MRYDAADRRHREKLEQLRHLRESDAAALGMKAFARATSSAWAAAVQAEARLAEATAEAEKLRAAAAEKKSGEGQSMQREKEVSPIEGVDCSTDTLRDAKRLLTTMDESTAAAGTAATEKTDPNPPPHRCAAASQTELRLGVGAVYGLGLPWGGGNGVVGACSSPLHRWLEQQVRAPPPGGVHLREVSDSAASSLPVHGS